MTSNKPRIRMNLSSEPVRNRRLFFAASGALAAGILFAAAAGGWLLARVHGRVRSVRSELVRLERLETDARAETRKYDQENAKFVKASKADVDRVNEVIERKAFSWVDFLTLMEEALPGPSYILSLSPLSTEKAFMEIKFKIVSTDEGELIRFIEKLEKLRFGPIRVLSKARGDGGELVSDILVGYERRK